MRKRLMAAPDRMERLPISCGEKPSFKAAEEVAGVPEEGLGEGAGDQQRLVINSEGTERCIDRPSGDSENKPPDGAAKT
jgi:hypothetical protein